MIFCLSHRLRILQSPFLDSDMQSRWFDFGGTTVVRADQYVRLTTDHSSQAGWIFSRVPLTATNWEIEVEFAITGAGHLFGDGMAMWVTKDRAEMGPVFGMKDRFEGLGIFFDTYKNNRPGVVFPYVMAMLGDGQTSYDQANDGKANELAGCSARGIRNSDIATKVKVTYFQDKELTVDLMYKQEDVWTRCFEVPTLSASRQRTSTRLRAAVRALQGARITAGTSESRSSRSEVAAGHGQSQSSSYSELYVPLAG